ncbi:MAG: type VI secretion system contractile sheath large subunit [Bryobacteraceae bacterium]
MASFRILVLGDFGAAAAPARLVLVDRDNLEQVMKRLDVRLELPGAGTLRFNELDDFHPDRLYQSLDLFKGLREMRAYAEDPEFRTSTPQPPGVSLLDEIVDAGAAVAARKKDPLQEYLQDVVAPYIVPLDPKKGDRIAQVDAATSEAMRALLHDRRFQALEAAWRALDFLVRRTDAKVRALHLPKEKLAADLLYRALRDDPADLIAANYSFGPGNEDIEMMGRVALLASTANSPMIARADAALLGDAQELAAWSELQKIPEARYIGLALPGFLLRLPYGKETSPIDAFAFEEATPELKHSEYLWGNPAFACAYLAAEAPELDIENLPAHVYKKDGETVMKPCAEVLMTESEAEALIDRGLIPLLSMRDSDRVHVAGLRSINGHPLFSGVNRM